jgi:hypothetical protein
VYADGEPVGDPVPHDEGGRPARSIPKPKEEPAAGGEATAPGGEAAGADRPEGEWF